MMRGMAIAAAFAVLAACSAATPAGAQASDAYTGTWAFQTEPYGSQGVAAIMSGAAVISPGENGVYNIRLLVNELVTQANTGRSALITARENCRGEVQDTQFYITCEMAEPLEGYQPDTFILQAGEADQLVGALSSSSSSQATFTRMR